MVQFQADRLAPDSEAAMVNRFLEAYLMWLFGWVLFPNADGHVMDKALIPYARQIADAAEGEVPLWSWGSAVLAALYRGLCQACSRTQELANFTGCALLLQLWSYERFAIARPIVNLDPYDEDMYGADPEDAPTMGSLWCVRRVRLFTTGTK
jgi:hypothetical protein